MKGRTRAALLIGLLVVLPAALYLGVYLTYRLTPVPGLTPAAADEAIGGLRRALGGDKGPLELRQDLSLDGTGPLWVSIFLDGKRRFSSRQDSGGLAARLEAARSALAADPWAAGLTPDARRRARFKLDLAVGEGAIMSSVPLMMAKGLVPGLDGIGLAAGDRAAYLLPDELYQLELMSGYKPFFFMHEFKTGLDLQGVVDLLAGRLDLSEEQWRTLPRRYFRFRIDAHVEAPGGEGKALKVTRLRAPVEELSVKTVRLAVRRAADYVLRQMRADGKFEYIYFPLDDAHSPPGEYSLPRHAGTTWFLSLAFSTTKDQKIRAAADRAITYLAANAVPDACKETPYACVGSDGRADLGSASLTVVAIAEYTQATGSKRYLPLARRLGKFILHMQKPNGDFCHQYNPAKKERNCHDVLLYYTGEAALGLAKLNQVSPSKEYVAALERTMDFLVGEKYDFFLGQFFISEDHWTCIAAEAAYPAVDKQAYADFCHEFAKLNRRAQVRRDEGLMADLAGAFTITPFFMPHNTPVGSRTESNVGTYLLSRKRGAPDPVAREVVVEALRYLVDHQISPETAYLYPNPSAAVGAILQTPIRASVRIDYVQHAAAALARAIPILEE